MKERALKIERGDKANALLTCIAMGGRHFFHHEDRIARFEVDERGRIFPIYYLSLAAALLFADPDARAAWGWAASYTLNLHIAATGQLAGSITHFWTLCVEEQFYLVWPCVVVFASRRVATWAALGMIVAGPMFRAWTDPMLWHATPSSLDALGIGCLLALHHERLPAVRTWALAGVLLTALYLEFNGVALRIASTLGLGLLVLGVAKGHFGPLGTRPLAYLGRISYGLYLYHPLVLYAALSATGNAERGVMLAVPCVFALAALSWRYVEQPIMRRAVFAPAVESRPERLPVSVA